MSKFSDYLADCVHNSHLNVSQLAKLAGFNRTHLQINRRTVYKQRRAIYRYIERIESAMGKRTGITKII